MGSPERVRGSSPTRLTDYRNDVNVLHANDMIPKTDVLGREALAVVYSVDPVEIPHPDIYRDKLPAPSRDNKVILCPNKEIEINAWVDPILSEIKAEKIVFNDFKGRFNPEPFLNALVENPNTKTRSLTIIGLDIQRLWPYIVKIPSLTHLQIERSDIVEIPSDIKNLQNLVALALSNNQHLQQISSELRKLPKFILLSCDQKTISCLNEIDLSNAHHVHMGPENLIYFKINM